MVGQGISKSTRSAGIALIALSPLVTLGNGEGQILSGGLASNSDRRRSIGRDGLRFEAADSADDSAAAADLLEFVALRAARSASAFAEDTLDPALVSEDLASAAEAAAWSLIAPTSATDSPMTPAIWTEDL